MLGYNFSEAFHIGTTWSTNDQICLTMNGKTIANTLINKAINALAQCTEALFPVHVRMDAILIFAFIFDFIFNFYDNLAVF